MSSSEGDFLKLLESSIRVDFDYIFVFLKRRISNEEFISLKTDADHVKYLKQFLKGIDLPKVRKKCASKSTELRAKGNDFFVKKSCLDAIQTYTESLAYAPTDSKEYSLALSNRSASLLDIQALTEAQRDIETALNLPQTPVSVKDKLLKRQERCNFKLECLYCIGPQAQPPELDSNNEYFDSASSKVHLAHDSRWGRYLKAKGSIKTGEVLIVEKPYCSILTSENRYTHCSHCIKRCLNLIPCLYCPVVMFCSVHCRDISYQSYHKVECPLLGQMIELEALPCDLLVLRTYAKAVCEAGSFEKLINQIHSETQSEVYKASDFLNIYNLVGNKEKRPFTDLVKKAAISATILKLIELSGSFEKNSNLSYLLGGLLFRLRQSFPCNAHQISEYQRMEDWRDSVVEIGAAACATLSLLNHSCNPNVTRQNFGDIIVLRALRLISDGEEIVDNYGYHYATMKKKERQDGLWEQYYFNCKCRACLENWPTFEELDVNIILKAENLCKKVVAQKFVDSVENILRDVYKNKLDKDPLPNLFDASDFLNDHVKRPCAIFNKCEECIKFCLDLSANHFFHCDVKPSVYSNYSHTG